MIEVKRRSSISGKMNTRMLPITQEQVDEWVEEGTMIQNAFPWLNANEREFLLSGATEEEWDTLFEGDYECD